jgi:predicted alpha-1,2-mannosidase
MPRSRFLVRAATAAALLSGGALVPLCTTESASAAAGTSYVNDPAALVNPLIGTANGGDVFPGADRPFGMIQWSPDTPSRPAGGGYAYGDKAITGYSLTHISGPGCGAADDIPILPTTGAVPSDPENATEPLDHSQETASPGYYSLDSGGVTTQLSTTARAGIARFSFPSGTSAGNLLFKLSDSGAPDSATHFQVVSDKEISGYVTTGDFCGASNQYTLHFDMTFNRPITGYGTWTNGSAPQAQAKSLTTKLTAPQRARARKRAKVAGLNALATDGLAGSRSSRNGKLRADGSTATAATSAPVTGADGAYVTFDTSSQATVKAKVGISYVSTDNASANLAKEIPAWSFAAVKNAAHSVWNRALSKIQVAGGTATQQTVFYTALYHSLLHPNVDSDDNGQYMGFDGQVHTTAKAHPIYANYSGWDIYRSQSQLEAMLFPKRMSDTVTSMLDDYDQTGELPKWSEDNGESYVMVGDPSDPIIADAYAFDARGFDTRQALTDMQTEASVPNDVRPGLSDYLDDGYLPVDGSYGCCNFYGPVSTQEEYNAADDSIAALASALGKSSIADTFATRANNWQNVYNPGSGFLQPKLADGAFQSGFDPTSSNGFVEADAYVYAAELPFDVAGLVKAEGGKANWETFLDGLTSSVTGMGATQAQLGNEPSFDIPWEYDYVGAPAKAEQVVREVQDELYTDTPGGLAGNDDLGAMSSWYVWSAIGAYPETPGAATTALGSPEFTNVKIHLGNGKTVTESAPQAADDAPYVQSMSVNGSAWNMAHLPATMFTKGGTIDWSLATTPSTTFADTAAAAPPSDTSGLLPALGDVGGPDKSSLEVLNPGDATTLTLGVQSMTSGSQTVSWTASVTAGSGLQLGPTSGSLIVGGEKHATQQVSLTVPAGTADGQYQVTFHLHTATGTALPDVVEDIGVAQPGDMAPYYNDAGISSDTDQGAANFDGDGFSYSEQALAAQGITLGGAVTAGNVKYMFPSAAAGTPDSVTAGGQTIKVLPVSGATTIGFLGSATNGPSTGQVTIHYTDGSSQTETLGFSDWTLNANGASLSYGNVAVANTPYRNSVGGTSQTIDTYLLSAGFPLTAGKTVESVTLPASASQGSLHVFAIGSDAGPLTK